MGTAGTGNCSSIVGANPPLPTGLAGGDWAVFGTSWLKKKKISQTRGGVWLTPPEAGPGGGVRRAGSWTWLAHTKKSKTGKNKLAKKNPNPK